MQMGLDYYSVVYSFSQVSVRPIFSEHLNCDHLDSPPNFYELPLLQHQI